MKAEYKELTEIDETGELLAKVRYKPVQWFVIGGIVGLILAIVGYVVPLKWFFVSGVFAIFYSMFSIFSIPDRWVCSVYDDAVIFFSAEPRQRGFRIANKEITEYNVDKNEKHHLYIKVKDGSEFKAKSYRYDKKFRSALTESLKGKETDEIRERRSKK